jgi:hypothetical protein
VEKQGSRYIDYGDVMTIKDQRATSKKRKITIEMVYGKPE